jgi:hypothetical protein
MNQAVTTCAPMAEAPMLKCYASAWRQQTQLSVYGGLYTVQVITNNKTYYNKLIKE